jgi:hypothetical protein
MADTRLAALDRNIRILGQVSGECREIGAELQQLTGRLFMSRLVGKRVDAILAICKTITSSLSKQLEQLSELLKESGTT